MQPIFKKMDLFTGAHVLFIIHVLGTVFFAVLFLQSGVDKVTDWKGNLSWLTGHFENSLFAKIVPILLKVITVSEILAGVLCSAGAVELIFYGNNNFALMGVALSLTNILMLFTGQRIAKEYEGAAVLVNYFILGIVVLFFLRVT